jgi:hypothetical protein
MQGKAGFLHRVRNGHGLEIPSVMHLLRFGIHKGIISC